VLVRIYGDSAEHKTSLHANFSGVFCDVPGVRMGDAVAVMTSCRAAAVARDMKYFHIA